MDIRIARTDRAIEKAFMELRAKNPLEKIKIKDLCALACINKSTFYAHYEDITRRKLASSGQWRVCRCTPPVIRLSRHSGVSAACRRNRSTS